MDLNLLMQRRVSQKHTAISIAAQKSACEHHLADALHWTLVAPTDCISPAVSQKVGIRAAGVTPEYAKKNTYLNGEETIGI
jgi:hypothetical protein